MKLGEELANLRASYDMTQEELAEKIGVSRQAVTKWEASESVPELPKLIQLADFFGISLDKLVGREPLLYDIVKAKVEELSANCRRAYDGDDVSPFINRYLKYSESIGLSADQIVNGIQYICGEADI